MALRTRLSPLTILLVTVLVIAVFSVETVAFGAGNIPSYGYLEGKAFRVDPLCFVVRVLPCLYSCYYRVLLSVRVVVLCLRGY